MKVLKDMEDKIVVIVNGRPRSGKDTFCNFVIKNCEEKNKNCDVWSTIDFEKELLEDIVNRPYDVNSEKDRAFLSEFKQLVNRYYDITFRDFVNLIEFYDGIFLIHSREWNEINRFKEYCENNNIKFITVFISSPNEKEYNNWSDTFCIDRKNMYDIIINNKGTLEELEEYAKQFCESRLF